jgi:hypothetical protein
MVDNPANQVAESHGPNTRQLYSITVKENDGMNTTIVIKALCCM